MELPNGSTEPPHMAVTRESLLAQIVEIEPENPIKSRVLEDLNVKFLRAELNAAGRRKTERESRNAPSGRLVYRTEPETLHRSWKIVLQDGEESGLMHGKHLPDDGATLSDDGRWYKVVGRREGLEVFASDLAIREKFDPRRVYSTPNGSRVAYKRTEANGMVVLWSYKTKGEVMVGGHIKLEPTDTVAQATAAAIKRMTQKVYAAWAIAQNPRITGSELTQALRENFPQNSIDQRHGPHYLSLSRNGKLPEAPDEDPRTWGRATQGPSEPHEE